MRISCAEREREGGDGIEEGGWERCVSSLFHIVRSLPMTRGKVGGGGAGGNGGLCLHEAIPSCPSVRDRCFRVHRLVCVSVSSSPTPSLSFTPSLFLFFSLSFSFFLSSRSLAFSLPSKTDSSILDTKSTTLNS